MQCELSGESLANAAAGTVVVTPSGHICRKDLLLTKLTENGGLDPFEPERPLSEDDLIALATSGANSNKMMPPRPLQASSVPSLLTALQSEYDAVLLELFDTRQALQDCRQELSQALYQNDAAVRVIARLSAERDAARQQLQEWQADGGESNKKRKRAALGDALANEIPEPDFAAIHAVWEGLHGGRKALIKSLGAAAPSKEQVAAYCAKATAKVWDASAATAAAVSGKQWAVATSDKLVKVGEESKSLATHKASDTPTAMDLANEWVMWGTAAGDVQLAKVGDSDDATPPTVHVESAVASVSLHYDKQHALVATQDGKLCLLACAPLSVVSVFTGASPVSYTTGCLHPDGLIYVAGTADGALWIWDLKSKSLAGSMQPDGGSSTAVRAVSVSPNGYHIVASYADGAVRVWDLRKQKVLATLSSSSSSSATPATAVGFDEAAKFVWYAAGDAITTVPVKEWTNTMTIASKGANLVFAAWSAECGIVGADDAGFSCYGKPS